MSKFQKHDNGKVRYSLIPQETLDQLVAVLEYGAAKYAPNNWQKCKDPTRYMDAMLRHLAEWRKGKIVDEESGLPHLWHVLTNAAFLAYLGKVGGQDGGV